MPWREVSVVDMRCEFVMLSASDDVTMRELCRRYGVSPTTGYKWRRRLLAEGVSGLNSITGTHYLIQLRGHNT